MIIKNGIKYDYSFIESCLSILPACDEFVFVEGEGDDGTYEKLLEFQAGQPKVRVIRHPWTKEHYNVLSELTNVAIEACTGDYHLQIQADEAIHESYHAKIRQLMDTGADMFLFKAIHFYSGFSTIYRPGVFYDGFHRMAKRSKYPGIRSYSDAMSLGNPESDGYKMHDALDVPFYHYGYVRMPKALIEKQKQMTKWWGYQELDQYLADGEAAGKINWLQKHHPDRLEKFTGQHPTPMIPWIDARRVAVVTGEVS